MANCRACLVKSEDVVMFDENSVSTFNMLTNLCVSEDDGLPQHFCKICYDTLNNFGQFREKCISVDAVLRSEKLCEVQIKYETIKEESIKTEEFYYGDDDNIYYEEEYLDENDEIDSSNNYIIESDGKSDTKPKRSERIRSNSKKRICSEVDANIVGKVTAQIGYDKKLIQSVRIKGTQRGVKKARRVIMNNKQIVCGLCPKYFDNEELCMKHVLIHKDHNKCSICCQQFNDWWQTLAHRLVHEPSTKCYICLKKFKTPPTLEFHYKKVHSGEENVQLECNQCLKKYKTPLRLRKHRSVAHSDKVYICDICQKVFKNKSNVRVHVKMHLNKKTEKCELCDFACNSVTSLKNHILCKHTNDKVYCKVCERWYKHQTTYDAHQCNPKPPEICPVCGKEVKFRQLRLHMMTHTTIMPHKCSRCPAAFRNKASLNDHMDRHNGFRRRQCEYCPMAFYTAAVLMKHRRVHTGIKPYVCRICQKAFTGSFNLKVHMKVHGEDLIKKKVKEDTKP